jgi:predicted helicase
MSSQIVKEYILQIIEKYQSGHAREHAYRPTLENLFISVTGLKVINDPKKSEHGAPDFVFLKNKTVIAYAEAKDITVSLDETAKSEQMNRYYGYSNLILTNALEFRFYRNGLAYCDPIIVGEIKVDSINSHEENFGLLEDTLKDFIEQAREPIVSGVVLAKVMAGKARRIRDNIKAFLKEDDIKKNEGLLSIFQVIQKLLLADLNPEKFADMYAQTLVYGLFVAKFYDTSDNAFTRQSARDLVPASNPFLRHFFDHIAGASFDSRIEIIVNELCEEFSHTDVNAIVHNYFKTEKDQSRDPIIHFYEDFLKEYNPEERLQLGVFYTPLPVVDFIVRSVDDILKINFNLQGLADTSKVEITKTIQGKKIKDSVHQVQILDPATGTGTFLNETILHIKKSFIGQEGRWPNYVKQDLLPRLHGFELMMAPYTIAHLKLSSTIKETGAELGTSRIGVYLTNSLEKAEISKQDLFSFGLGKAIAEESQDAGKIKNDLPIMVILGNPPYSGESMNPDYTDNNVYKFEPGTSQKLQERNSKWINDDYVKFIRFAESLIEKTGEGVLGMITAHGYLDNPTFRGMRYHLMQTFDALYVLDLHGNANKKEITETGSQDKNVFDIKQGVSILLAVKKTAKSKKLANVFRFDLQGLREEKFEFLTKNSLETISWKKLEPSEPNYEFIGRNIANQKEYADGFSVNELFITSSVGIVTSRDGFVIDEDKQVLEKRIKDFLASESPIQSLEKFGLKENQKWKAAKALTHVYDEKKVVPISYRPFDNRFIYFDDAFIERSRSEVMQHFLHGENIAFVALRQIKAGKTYQHVLVANKIVESTYISNKTSEIGYVFPLYLYPKNGERMMAGDAQTIPVVREPNLDLLVARKIAAGIDGVYYPVAEYLTNGTDKRISPEDIFNYTYAYLYAPAYRDKYNDFLKIDFPRVPYPKDTKQFSELVKLGLELRKLHLLESPKVLQFITTYPELGDGKVEKIEFKDGKVYINQSQYFGNVPQEAWDFYIGGYQPAQKWLKDRKGHILSSENIEHFQKIIVSLTETNRIMNDIDKLLVT